MKRQNNFRQLQVFKKPKTISCIENLCNEIVYEIFDYLDGYDIYRAFSNLNIRFENLINNSSLLFNVDICFETDLDSCFEQFIKSQKQRIISFEFNDEFCFDRFLNWFMIDSLFVRLESVIIRNTSTYRLFTILFYLKSLPNLSSLSFSINDCKDDIGHIYQMIFCLSLKYFLIELEDKPQLPVNIPISAQDQYSSIEHLSIYHHCTLDRLISILSHTPKLSHLYCFNIIKSYDWFKPKLMIELNNLVHLRMSLCYVTFNEFEQFLLKLCSNLKFLKVKVHSTDPSYLDADRWKYLIEEKIPDLNKFIFRYYDTVDEDFKITPYHLLINRFTSSFWIERKWIFKISVEDDVLIYLVRPYQENWIHFQDHASSNDCLQSVEISINGNFLTEDDEPMINKIGPIFAGIELTHLNIECDEMSASMLITTLNALPNLKSMVISNSPLHQSMRLHKIHQHLLQQFLDMNKITKITLLNLTKSGRIGFIFKKFPRLEYFEFYYVKGKDLLTTMAYILKNIQINFIIHPITICVVCDDAEYNQTRKLHHMIKSKYSFNNFSIGRQQDRFYVHLN